MTFNPALQDITERRVRQVVRLRGRSGRPSGESVCLAMEKARPDEIGFLKQGRLPGGKRYLDGCTPLVVEVDRAV